MPSAAPSYGASAQQTPPGRGRILVGARFGPDEFAALGLRAEGVEIEADAAALAHRALEGSVRLVLVDRSLPGLSASIVAQLTKRREPRAPVVFLSHAEIVGTLELTLKYWRDVASHGGASEERSDEAWCALLALAAVRPPANGSQAAAASTQDPIALLVRPRSREEEGAAKRRALEAAFRERERLLDGCVSTQQVASLLGVTRQTPHDRVKAKTLLAVEDKSILKFPLWQFDPEGPGGVVEGLPDVLRVLRVGDLAKVRWLERPNPVFEGRSPLEALKAGEVERVVREAQGVGAAAGHG